MPDIYPIKYGAPDLSDVYKIARNTGRNQGLIKALEGELDFRRDLYKKRVEDQVAAAKKTAAATAASSDPENESFWDKLDQLGKDIVDKQEHALSWVGDKIQRGMYGVENAWAEANKQAYQEDRSPFDVSGVGDVVDSFWKGATGKEPMIGSKLIAEQGARDPGKDWRDNSIMQGVVGFGLDVAFDPLSYVGAGLVTRPLKAAKAAKDTSRLDDLAREVEKLGVKPGADFTGARAGVERDAPLTFDEIRSMLSPGKFAGNTAAAQRAANMRAATEGLPQLKKWIKEQPDLDVPETLTKLDDEIARVQKQRKDILSGTERKAYEEALAKAEANPSMYAHKIPNIKDLPRVSILKDWERSVKLDTVAKAFKAEFFKRGKNAKPDAKGLDDLLGEGWKADKRISPEFKENAYDTVSRVARNDDTHRILVRQQRVLQEQKSSIFTKIEDAKKDKNFAEADRLQKYYDSKIKPKINSNYDKQYRAKAEIFSALLRNHLADPGNMDQGLARELSELMAERPVIARDIERLQAQDTGASVSGMELSENAVRASGDESLTEAGKQRAKDMGADNEGIVYNQQRELEDRLKEIDDRIGEITNTEEFLKVRDKLEVPESLGKDFKITPEWLASKSDDPAEESFKNAIKKEIEERKDSRYEQLLETERRRNREGSVGALLDEIVTKASNKGSVLFRPLTGKFEGKNPLKTMFGNSAMKQSDLTAASVGDYFKHPRVYIDDKPIYQADKKVLAEQVTKADIENAAKSVTEKPESVKQAMGILEKIKGLEVRLLEGTTNRKGLVTDLDDATLDAIIARTSTEEKFIGKAKGKSSVYQKVDDTLTDDAIEAYDNLAKSTVNEFENIDLDVAEAARLARRLKDARDDLKALQSSSKTFKAPEHEAFDRLFREQFGMSRANAVRAKNRAIQTLRTKLPNIEKSRKFNAVDPGRKAELAHQARMDALADVQKQHEKGNLTVRTQKDLEFEAWDDDAASRMHDSLVEQAKQDYAMEVANAKATLRGRELEAKLNGLRQERDLKLALHKEAYDEAVKARKAMDERLDEQLLLDILEENVQRSGKHLQVNVAGVTLGEFRSPVAMLEKMGHLPIIKQANAVWASGFKPASMIEPELNLARLRAQANTPLIIKHHIDDISSRFAKYQPAERKAALKSLKTGVPVGNTQLYNDMKEYFEEMLPYLQGKVGITDESGNVIDALKISDINRYLGSHFRFEGKKSKYVDNLEFNNVEDVLKHMRNLPHNEDAMKVMWQLRIAMEQALSKKALGHTIKKIYGVQRPAVSKIAADADEESSKIIEALQKEHNWRTVGELGVDHYFAPEVADDIEKLMDMMKPQNVHRIMQNYDKAIRAWKTAVTVYNPGYYTRNAIGETIMSWFDGMTDPKWHFKSAQIIKYAMPDAMEDTLKQLEPWKKHQTITQKGARPVMTLRNGKTLSAEDVWVLYNDVGLKSGFISSEFDHYFPTGGSMKATGLGQKAIKFNDKVRDKGEKFEDFFRLSHFMYRMNKSKLTDPLKAAEEAAEKVRKYHFDYTDFTPFEKSTMLRLFPFYKWTRKAMPLMASMLFTKPGKVMVYPKAMQAASTAFGGSDPLTDNNGVMPNFEDVVPKWMKDMLAYPMGRDADNAMTYMNVATPQFDVYKMLANPVGTSVGMLSPVPKTIIEQINGHPLDPEFKGMEMEGAQDRFNSLMRTTPITNLLNRIPNEEMNPEKESPFGEPGGIDEKLLSFLTGLGFSENSKARQQGELMRRKEAGQ